MNFSSEPNTGSLLRPVVYKLTTLAFLCLLAHLCKLCLSLCNKPEGSEELPRLMQNHKLKTLWNSILARIKFPSNLDDYVIGVWITLQGETT